MGEIQLNHKKQFGTFPKKLLFEHLQIFGKCAGFHYYVFQGLEVWVKKTTNFNSKNWGLGEEGEKTKRRNWVWFGFGVWCL